MLDRIEGWFQAKTEQPVTQMITRLLIGIAIWQPLLPIKTSHIRVVCECAHIHTHTFVCIYIRMFVIMRLIDNT